MPYIITADVLTDVEENRGADKTKVDARILVERPGEITFNVRGDFEQQAALTKALCNSLVDAGFLAFSIRHSF